MLDSKTMTNLEALIGLEGGALKEAIESDDSKEITIPKGLFVSEDDHTVFTKKELLKHDDHLKETHEKAGREMLVKEYKREKGLEFDGKTIDHLLKFSNGAALEEAGKEPDARIRELESKNSKLVELNDGWEAKHNSLIEANGLADLKRGNDNDIIGFMGGEYSIPKADMLTIFNSKHQITSTDGVRTVSRNGEKLEDGKTFEPLGLESIVSEFSKQYAKVTEGGSGGGDEGGSGSGGSLANFDKRMAAEGHNKGGESYMKEMNKAIDNKTLTI